MQYLWRSIALFAMSPLLFPPLLTHATEQTATDANTQNDAFPDLEYAIVETTLSCEEVNRTTQRAIERLGYEILSFTSATPDKAGILKGSRTFTWGDKEPVTVTITCKQGSIDVDARPDVPPCEQANRISRFAIEHLGYKITKFTPAAVGKPGIVKGQQDGQPEIYIALGCEGRMVTMDTSSDSPLLKNREFFTALKDFRRGFFATYKAQRGIVTPPPTPPSTNQVQVTMRPLSKSDSQAALGVEMTQAVAVHVQLTNPTKRSYQLETDKIALVSITGERVKPLLEKEGAFPTQGLTNQALTPGATVKGYLYYPPGTYTGARGSLTEEKSQEREGFEAPFQ